MIFRQLFDSVSSTYTYLLGDEGSREAVIIDTVFEQHERDAALVRELGLKLVWVLDTHVHADHVTGAWLMREELGPKVAVSARSGAEGPDRLLQDGDEIRFGARSLRAAATPGHTNGCLTYVLDDRSMAFTGDALLIRGAGRTDFQQGNAHTLFHSITERILSLPTETLLYPAHDYSGRTVTSVEEERSYNPRVGGEANETDFVGFMENLGLPHPKQIDAAVPANLVCGRPADGVLPPPATWGPAERTYAGILEIDPEWVATHLGEVRVLDVRPAEEMNAPEPGAIEGALNIPIHELRDRVDEVPRGAPVIAVCRSGRRSGQATVILKKAGITDVANLKGGMLAWRQASLPVRPPG